MANISIGYDTSTGDFTIPDSTTVRGPHGTAQAITFTQAAPSQGWSLASINFTSSQFSQTSNNGNVVVMNDAFTDSSQTSHKYTVTVTVNGGRVTSPDPVIVNDPSSTTG